MTNDKLDAKYKLKELSRINLENEKKTLTIQNNIKTYPSKQITLFKIMKNDF